MAKRTLAVLGLVACTTGCMTWALQPRTTLEGKSFDAAKVDTVRQGLTESEVRDILGEPFAVTVDSGHTVWRYYERFTPRGCNPPVVSREFRVAFVAGLVVSREGSLPSANP